MDLGNCDLGWRWLHEWQMQALGGGGGGGGETEMELLIETDILSD